MSLAWFMVPRPGTRSTRDADHLSWPPSNLRMTVRCFPSAMTSTIGVPVALRNLAASSASTSPASVPGKVPGGIPDADVFVCVLDDIGFCSTGHGDASP